MASLSSDDISILIKTSADNQGLSSAKTGLNELDEATAKVSGTSKLAQFASQAFSVAAGVGLADLGQKAIGFAKDSVKAYSDYQATQAQLATVLKSTGDASKLNIDDLNDQADATSKLTAFSKTQIGASQALLLTFTNIHGAAFQQATPAILDLATAMHEDLQSASVQVGKALNDPITGITALHRIGVTFTDDQKKTIKSMVDTGNAAGAQTVILKELNKEFGGSAQAYGKTFPGEVQKAKNALEDFQINAVAKVKDELGKLEVAVMNLPWHTIKDAVMDVWNFIAGIFEKAWSVISPILTQFKYGIGGLISVLEGNGIDTHGGIVGFMEQLGLVILKVAHFIGILVHDDIAILKMGWDILTTAIRGLLPSIEALFGSLWHSLRPALISIYESVKRLWNAVNPALMDVLKVLAVIIGLTLYGAIWLFINALRLAIDVLAAVIHVIANVINWIADLVGWFGTAAVWAAKMVTDIFKWGSKLPDMLKDVWKSIKNDVSHLIDDIVNFFKTLPDRAIKAVGNLGSRIGGDLKGALHDIHIPGFAQGVQNFGGGLAMVGENGPELVNLPSGSSVIPNNQLNNMTNNKSVNIGTIVLSSPQAVQEFFTQLDRDTQLTSLGLSPARGIS